MLSIEHVWEWNRSWDALAIMVVYSTFRRDCRRKARLVTTDSDG